MSAELCRFYGWTVPDVDILSIEDARVYMKLGARIDRREKRELMVLNSAVWMDKKGRDTVWQSFQDEPEEKPTIMTPELREQGLRIQAELDRERNAV